MSEASKKANAAWVTLMTTLAYFVVATVKITHKELFLERPVKLPLLNVEMPLAYFSVVGPILVVAVHVFAMMMLSGLREKVECWNGLLKNEVAIRSERRRLRTHLDTSLLTQAFGREFDFRWAFFYGVASITVVVAPILTIGLMQIIFLPYQSVFITDAQRLLLLADCAITALLWPTKLALKLAFISSFMLFVIAPTWLVLVFPDRPRSNFIIVDQVVESTPLLRWSARKWLTGGADLVHHSASSWLTNRLVLPDQSLADDLGKEGATSNLRGRRLAFAILDRSDLHGVNFTGADMREASLRNTKLRAAKFACAETGESDQKLDDTAYSYSTRRAAEAKSIQIEFAIVRCSWLHGADLGEADLTGALLNGAILIGANISGGQLDRASFVSTQAEGASFSFASMNSANLREGLFDGADFAGSDLTLADLSASEAPGADFDETTLFGAKFANSFLRHASFGGAQLQGADLEKASFEDARLIGVATFRATPTTYAFKNAIVRNIDTTARWAIYLGWLGIGSGTVRECNRLFAMEGDPDCEQSGSIDIGPDRAFGYDDPAIFKDREPITLERVNDIIQAVNSDGSPDKAGRATQAEESALDALKPNSATPQEDQAVTDAWKAIMQSSAPPDSYATGIAARLELIACVGGAKLGQGDLSSDFAPYVARGLLRARRFDDTGTNKPRLIEMLKVAMKTGKKLDGSPCPGAVGLDDEDFQE
ncbi:MAG: pentapeptide repeat-containing protein [Roseiarcus sp.]